MALTVHMKTSENVYLFIKTYTSEYDFIWLIVHSHIISLLALKNIVYKCTEKLRTFLDNILKHIRAANIMNIALNNFSDKYLFELVTVFIYVKNQGSRLFKIGLFFILGARFL